MSLVRVLGSGRLTCGCVVGRYHELATHRDVTYVEEKGRECGNSTHRRNHTLLERAPPAASSPVMAMVRAS